jgi:hypothetical protein
MNAVVKRGLLLAALVSGVSSATVKAYEVAGPSVMRLNPGVRDFVSVVDKEVFTVPVVVVPVVDKEVFTVPVVDKEVFRNTVPDDSVN